MSPYLILFLLLAVVSYGGINFYIGIRGWQSTFSYLPFLSAKVYWLVYWLIALAYILARLTEKYLPKVLIHWFNLIGAYWLAAMFYFFLVILLIDALSWLSRLGHFSPKQGVSFNPALGISVIILVVGIITYGAWNARHPIIHHYDLQLNKQAGSLSSVNIVMVSDIHFGNIIHNLQLAEMVDKINKLHPDTVFLVGDIMDENIEPAAKQEMAAILARFQTKYGVYACLGNHEYIGGKTEETIYFMNKAGINVLRDQAVQIANSFNLIGRDDLSGARFWGNKRNDLSVLKNGLDTKLPLIVLDHQPSYLEEPEKQKVDLQFSGHTHAGQIWPVSLITKRIFEDDFGLMKKEDFHIIVSSGYGAWGPPVRLGNSPEIVDVRLVFVNESTR